MIWNDSESPKHLPDTFQTPFRHIQTPPNLLMLALWIEFPTAQPQLGKAVVEYNLFSNCFSINTVLVTSRINQTPSRNPPDTPRHNAITSVFSLSVASTRLFGTQSNLFGCFLRSTVYVLGTEVIGWCLEGVWRVSGWCQIGPSFCQDSVAGINIDKNHFV